MSPTATGGPPHTRAMPINGGGPVRASNGMKPNGVESANANRRTYPHLDDLVKVKPDVDANLPFPKILQIGETLAKQADTYYDFRRPDMALQEFMKASIVAQDILRYHPDYLTLKDKPQLNRQYIGLLKRISAQLTKFESVKETIREDNARSGVKPVVDMLSAGSDAMQLINGKEGNQTLAQSTQKEAANGISTGKKLPPPVQPKPDALHGKAIIPQDNTSKGTSPSDLAARFARLSGTAIQDPRIRTQPIVVPVAPATQTSAAIAVKSQPTMSRPTGPMELPSVPTTNPQQPKVSAEVNISGMPRAPDAIYSPDRSAESTAAGTLRSSSSFSNLSKYSAPRISKVGPPAQLLENSRRQYVPPSHTTSAPLSQKSLKRKQPTISDMTMISAEDLVELGQGSPSQRILFVDLRSRADFDSGHIMSQSIICVEPITLRSGISGDELGNTMVLAPESEQELYHKRHEFDVVVVYDQESTSLKSSPISDGGHAAKLQDFISAVDEYSYDKRLKRRPVLLVGGLNAWKELLGPSSLQPSQSTSNSLTLKSAPKKSARPVRRDYNPNKTPRRTISSRTLTREEEQKWDSALQPSPDTVDETSGDEFVYVRTTEDFFKRYPELPSIQESMISPPPALSHEQQSLHEQITMLTSKPPMRPPPALPRQRSSGILDRRLMVSPAHSAPSDTISNTAVVRGLTGLHNTGATCYMNAVVHSISAMPSIRDMLKDFRYPDEMAVIPSRPGENPGRHPQLMVRCLGNLLSHIWSGAYEFVKPKTFVSYVASAHKASSKQLRDDDQYGGRQQQAAFEFWFWLYDVLDDELTRKRNTPPFGAAWVNIPEKLVPRLNQIEPFWACLEAFPFVTSNHDSCLYDRMALQLCRRRICDRCGAEKRDFEMQGSISAILGVANRDGSINPPRSLVDTMSEQLAFSAPVDDVECAACKAAGREPNGPHHNIEMFATMPDYICIYLNRGASDRDEPILKNNQVILFPEYGLDLSRFVIPPPNPVPDSIPPSRKGPFLYDICAAIQHRGGTIRSGHYVTVAKSMDQPRHDSRGRPAAGSWHLFNDTQVTPSTFERTQTPETAVLFFKRQGRP